MLSFSRLSTILKLNFSCNEVENHQRYRNLSCRVCFGSLSSWAIQKCDWILIFPCLNKRTYKNDVAAKPGNIACRSGHQHSKNKTHVLGKGTSFGYKTKTGVVRILVIFQHRFMLSQINGKLSPRPFEWYGWAYAYVEKLPKYIPSPFWFHTHNRF